VENFPGYPDGVEPFTMMDDMRRQAERFGTQFVSGIVTKVDFSVSPKKVIVEDEIEYEADAVIVGSAVVRLVMENKLDEAGKLIGDIRHALDKKVN
jgi:thioredoxin reductase (NADPH)